MTQSHTDPQPIDVSQNHLNPKWLEFIKAYPTPTTPVFTPKKTKNFLEGTCTGYCVQRIEAHLLEHKAPSEAPKQKLKQTLITLAEKKEWDQKKDSLHSAFTSMYRGQHSRILCSIPISDIHKLNPRIQLLYTLTIPFTKENLDLIFKNIVFTEPELEQKAESHAMSCLFVANNHATELDLVTNILNKTVSFEYYDPNYKEGADCKLNAATLIDSVFAAHQFCSENILRFRIFGIDSRRFIPQTDFLKKLKVDDVDPSTIPNFVYESLRNDCHESFQFWKSKTKLTLSTHTWVRNGNACNLLHIAAFSGRENWISMLIKSGLSVCSQATITRSTPLHMVAEYGFREAAEILLAAGAPLYARTNKTPSARYKNFTPMGIAIKRNRVEIVRLFSQHTYFLGFPVAGDKDALDYAMELDRVEMAEILIQAGTPLGLDDTYMLRFLENAKSDAMKKMLMRVKTPDGKTIIEHAVLRGCVVAVKFILEKFNPQIPRKELLALPSDDRMRVVLLHHIYFSKAKLNMQRLEISYQDYCIRLLVSVLENNKKQIKKIFKESWMSLDGAQWQVTFRAALDDLPCTAETHRVVKNQIIKSQILLFQRKNKFNKLKVVGSQNLYKAIKQGNVSKINTLSAQDPELTYIAEDARRLISR